MNENVSMTKEEIYSKDYIPYSIKYGRMTSLIGVVASFVPLIVLALVFGVMPTAKAIAAAAAIRISACLVYYFIEPISFQPVLGIPGTYMAFLSGNISNLRVPCSSVAQQAAGVQEGTPEGAVISTVGVAVSVVVKHHDSDHRRSAWPADHFHDSGVARQCACLSGSCTLRRNADADGSLRTEDCNHLRAAEHHRIGSQQDDRLVRQLGCNSYQRFRFDFHRPRTYEYGVVR